LEFFERKVIASKKALLIFLKTPFWFIFSDLSTIIYNYYNFPQQEISSDGPS